MNDGIPTTIVAADDRELAALRAQLGALEVWCIRQTQSVRARLSDGDTPCVILADLRRDLVQLVADPQPPPDTDARAYAVEALRRAARRS
jgi:hypothetical protein